MLSVLVLEDFAMAAYLPLLAVLAAGGSVAAMPCSASAVAIVALGRGVRRCHTAGVTTSVDWSRIPTTSS